MYVCILRSPDEVEVLPISHQGEWVGKLGNTEMPEICILHGRRLEDIKLPAGYSD